MSALASPDQVFQQLVKQPNQVVLTPAEALEVWKIFRRGSAITTKQLDNFQYRAFLQAALIAAIDASAAMGWVETIFRAAYKPNATATKIIKAVLKRFVKQYIRSESKPVLYVAVINAIATNPNFRMISAGLDI